MCRAALTTPWADLVQFEIDLSGLGQDGISEQSLAALQERRRKRLFSTRLESSAHLEPGRDDALVPFVLPLLTQTIGSTGLERERSRTVFTADDVGSACVFYLRPGEADAFRQKLASDGWSEGLMVPAADEHAECGIGVRSNVARDHSGREPGLLVSALVEHDLDTTRTD